MNPIKRNSIPLLDPKHYYLGLAYDQRRGGWVGLVWCIGRMYEGFYENVQPWHTVYHVTQYVFPTAEEARLALNAAFKELEPLPPMEELHAQAQAVT